MNISTPLLTSCKPIHVLIFNLYFYRNGSNADWSLFISSFYQIRFSQKVSKQLLLSIQPNLWSRDSSIDIATSYGLDGRGVGVRAPVGAGFFSSPRRPARIWSPPSLQSNGYWRRGFPGVKRPKHEADNSLPTSAEIKNTWRYRSTPPYVLMV
jgi:hypothetical protein